MKRMWIMHRNTILSFSLILSLATWALVVSVKLYSYKPQNLFIRFSGSEVSVINEPVSEDLIIFEKNFLRTFVMYTYNFDSVSYIPNLNRGSYLYSNSLWNQIHDEMIPFQKKIVENKISQSSVVEKLTKTSDTSYELVTKTIYQTADQIEERKYKIKVSTQIVARTKENPWGMEVTSADQERIQ